MKKIINRKTYDTKTAEVILVRKIDEWDNVVALYRRKRAGDYFCTFRKVGDKLPYAMNTLLNVGALSMLDDMLNGNIYEILLAIKNHINDFEDIDLWRMINRQW